MDTEELPVTTGSLSDSQSACAGNGDTCQGPIQAWIGSTQRNRAIGTQLVCCQIGILTFANRDVGLRRIDDPSRRGRDQ